jgi:hypothetical protein
VDKFWDKTGEKCDRIVLYDYFFGGESLKSSCQIQNQAYSVITEARAEVESQQGDIRRKRLSIGGVN